MLKSIFLCGLIVLGLTMFLGQTNWLYAETTQRRVTLTTYYPAPYGEYKKLTVSDNVGIGTTTPEAALDITSTTSGFLPPRMTTTQRNAITPLTQGMVIFNTTTDRLEVYSSTGWVSAGGGAQIVSAVASTFSTSSTAWVNVVSITQNFPGGMSFAFFETKVGVSAPLVATNAYFRLLIDGVEQDQHYARGEFYSFNDTLALSWAGNLSAASHTIQVQCYIRGSGGSVSASDTPRLTVIY